MKYILLLTALLTTTAFAAPDFDETMAAAKQGDGFLDVLLHNAML